MNTLWIVCPVYRDVPPFLEVRRQVCRHIAEMSLMPARRLRFLVVDDSGNQDREMSTLARLEDVCVVHPPFNLGHQGAVVFGLRSLAAHVAGDDWIVTMDADGEDQPADLPRLLGPLQGLAPGTLRVVLAYRGKRHESVRFKLLYAGFKLLFRILTGTVIRTGNYAAFPGTVTQQLLFHRSFDLSYSSTLLSLNITPVLIPCDRGRRSIGTSKMGLGALLRHGFRMLMPFADRVAARALIAFTLLFAIALAAFGLIVAMRWGTPWTIPPWTWEVLLAVLVVSVTALGHSVILFMLVAQSEGRALQGLPLAPVDVDANGRRTTQYVAPFAVHAGTE
jgi:hypothetical protein